MTVFNPGDIVRLYTDPGFTNAAGALTDPTTVTVRWRLAGSTTWTSWLYGTDVEVVKESTGVYHADVPLTTAGRLFFAWVGTGAVTAAEGSSLRVHALPGDV